MLEFRETMDPDSLDVLRGGVLGVKIGKSIRVDVELCGECLAALSHIIEAANEMPGTET